MTKFRIDQTVKILSSKKSDGGYNYGRVIGIGLVPEVCEDEIGMLSYSFERERYEVFYFDDDTNEYIVKWFDDHDLCIC